MFTDQLHNEGTLVHSCAYLHIPQSQLYKYLFEAGMHNGGYVVNEVEAGNTHASISFRDR